MNTTLAVKGGLTFLLALFVLFDSTSMLLSVMVELIFALVAGVIIWRYIPNA